MLASKTLQKNQHKYLRHLLKFCLIFIIVIGIFLGLNNRPLSMILGLIDQKFNGYLTDRYAKSRK